LSAAFSPDGRWPAAWPWEIVAGVQDDGLSVKEVAHKELLQEAGCKVVGYLQYLTTIYPSPVGTSERVHLFLGHADRPQKAAPGGGADEGEATQIVVLSMPEASDQVARGEIRDAKTIIALQHLALSKARNAAEQRLP
jgi:ADP-ribose pyrophosphatase